MYFLNLLVTFFTQYGYLAVFSVLIFCGLGLPVPEDISLVAGGVISSVGNTNVHVMFLVGMTGVLIGDGFVFTMGRVFGKKILEIKLVAHFITPARYEKVQEQFSKYGKWVIFMGRFMPGLRTPIFLTAGITGKVSALIFFTTDFLAAIISVPVWVYLGYYTANNFELLMKWVHQGQMTIVIALTVAILGFILYKKFKKRKID